MNIDKWILGPAARVLSYGLLLYAAQKYDLDAPTYLMAFGALFFNEGRVSMTSSRLREAESKISELESKLGENNAPGQENP